MDKETHTSHREKLLRRKRRPQSFDDPLASPWRGRARAGTRGPHAQSAACSVVAARPERPRDEWLHQPEYFISNSDEQQLFPRGRGK